MAFDQTTESSVITKRQIEPGSSASKTKELDALDKNKALEVVRKRYNRARQSYTFDFERFARYYRLFRNRQTKKNYQGLANLFVPEPYRIVRKKTAKLANAIRNVKVIAEAPNDTEAAKTGTQLLNFLRRKLNWQVIERTAIQESRIIGLSWLKVLWNTARESEELPYLGFDLSFETADKVFIDPDGTMLDALNGRLRWVIHEYDKTYQDLSLNSNYDPEALERLKLRGMVRTDATQLMQARVFFPHKSKLSDDQFRLHKIKEYWGKYVVDQESQAEEDYLIVIADDTEVLRFEPNPYKELLDNPIPFVPVVGNLVGQELFPVGDLEPAESLFNELNDTRNQRMDTVTLNIDPPKEIVRGANIDEKELVARRGWVIHSNIPNGVRFVPPDTQGVVAAINEEKIIRSDIQQATGIIDFTQGAETQAGLSVDTARGAIIAKGEADVQTEDELLILKTSLQMLYRIILAYAQAFLDREFVIRLVEHGVETFKPVSAESIKGNLDLDIEMNTLQDKTTEQQLKLLMFNQAKTVPGANIGRFFVDVLESFFENVNIQEYYQEPQPQGPPPPSINISLKGDLNPAEVDEVYKLTGADPQAADPLMRPELRDLMRGELPEHSDRQAKNVEILQKQTDILNSLEGKNKGQELSDE